MARLNDIPGPSSQSCKGKEPEQTEWNWRSSIMIDVDEHNESGQHEVTLEEFLGYVREKPEWL